MARVLEKDVALDGPNADCVVLEELELEELKLEELELELEELELEPEVSEFTPGDLTEPEPAAARLPRGLTGAGAGDGGKGTGDRSASFAGRFRTVGVAAGSGPVALVQSHARTRRARDIAGADGAGT